MYIVMAVVLLEHNNLVHTLVVSPVASQAQIWDKISFLAGVNPRAYLRHVDAGDSGAAQMLVHSNSILRK
jgi:hypothetical protein